MSAATIVFADIVSFSKKPTAEQRRLVESLTSEVLYEVRPLLIPPLGTPSLVALPTGDGLALAFLHPSDRLWNRSTLLQLIMRIHQWAFKQTTPDSSVSVRVGVHVGPVELVTDINGKANVCGDTINYAQRVMDAANARQTLFSEAAFREYIGTETAYLSTYPFSEDLKAIFQGPIEVYAKHGLQILVYKLALEPLLPYWSNDDPIAKHLMLVTLTSLPKEIVGSFSDQVAQATHIAFIQLTGERFLKRYKNGEISFSKQLKTFWVFMPDPEMYSKMHLTDQQAPYQLLKDCISSWQNLLGELKTHFPSAEFKLGLFKESPYFGASFIDWERPGGKIHVSPYVWNVATPDCPGYDLSWIGKTPSSIYEIYVDGLQYLNRSTNNVIKNGELSEKNSPDSKII